MSQTNQVTTTSGTPSAPMTPQLVVVLLSLLLGIQPITTDLYLPALPSLTQDLSGSMMQAQLTLTALSLAFGISQLFWGPLSDRFGRRPILVWGHGVFYAVIDRLHDRTHLRIADRMASSSGCRHGRSRIHRTSDR